MWAPIPIYTSRTDFRSLEMALIQEWQPKLNFPFICQFFHPKRGILKKPLLNTSAKFGLATLWRRSRHKFTPQIVRQILTSTRFQNRLELWTIMHALGSNTKARFEQIKMLRSNNGGLTMCYALRRLANNTQEPFRTLSLNAIDSTIKWWRGKPAPRLQKLDARSSLIAGALATLLIATAPEEFGIPECTTTIEAAGLSGAHRWGIILPNSSRVSMLTYRAIVAVRYPELVFQDGNHTNIGHFVPHEATVMQGGFRTLLWNAPKDLRLAVEDMVTFCNYLRNCYLSLRQGVTSQLLILCNRTAVHNLLLQHGFQTEWCGALSVSTTSSGAGATSRIAVIVQTGCGFLSGGRRGATLDDKEDCYGRATVALTRAIEHTYKGGPYRVSKKYADFRGQK